MQRFRWLGGTSDSGVRLRIRDPRLFRAALWAVIRDRFDGNLHEAARFVWGKEKVGTYAPVLARLVNGSRPEITMKRVTELRLLWGKDQPDDFFRAIEAPAVVARRRLWEQWLKANEISAGGEVAEELHPTLSVKSALSSRPWPRMEMLVHNANSREGLSLLRRDFDGLWQRVSPRVAAWLRSLGPQERGALSKERMAVSMRNVLGPLLESARSGFVERAWSELTPDELLQFIEHGLARERILLCRESAEVRLGSRMLGYYATHPDTEFAPLLLRKGTPRVPTPRERYRAEKAKRPKR